MAARALRLWQALYRPNQPYLWESAAFQKRLAKAVSPRQEGGERAREPVRREEARLKLQEQTARQEWVPARPFAGGEPVATRFQRELAQAARLLPVAVTGPVAEPVLRPELAPPPAAGTGSAPDRSSGLVAGSRRGLVRSIAAVSGFVPGPVPDPVPELGAAGQPALAQSLAVALDPALDSALDPALDFALDSALDPVAGIEAAATDSG